MSGKTIAVLVLCLALGGGAVAAYFLLRGSGDGEPAPKEVLRPVPKGAATPEAVWEKLRDALVKKDKARFLSCFDGSDEELEGLGLIYEFQLASHAFRKAVVGAYGVDAWDAITDTGASCGAIRLETFPPEKAEWGHVEIRTEGDKATCMDPRNPWGFEVHLLRKGDVWLAVAKDIFTGKTLEIEAKVLREHQAEAGKGKLSLEELDQKLVQAFMQAMFE